MDSKSQEIGGAGKRAWRFVQAFVREPMKVGAIWPSSDQLSRAIADTCEFAPEDTVVELGPGTGNFTELLLQRLQPPGRLVALELSETNVNVLKRRFPQSEIHFDSAEHISRYIHPGTARCIVSGLAWGNMLPALQDRIMDAILTALVAGGEFVGFAYAHARYYPTTLRFRKLMQTRFTSFETTPIIWRNVPPAYVYGCRK